MQLTERDQEIVQYIEAGRDRFIADLKEWLAIPSVSGDPAYATEVRRSAGWLADYLRGQGFPTVEIWDTPGLPAVYAEWPAADPSALRTTRPSGTTRCKDETGRRTPPEGTPS